MLAGIKVPAKVLRLQDDDGELVEEHEITLRKFMDIIFQPQSVKTMLDEFGVPINGLLTFADWPKGDDDRPIRRGDVLCVDGKQYPVVGVKAYTGHHLEVYVQAP